MSSRPAETVDLYERVIKRYVVDDIRPGVETQVRSELPDLSALLAYYGYVAETHSPEADLESAVDGSLNARSRIGQPLHAIFGYGWHLDTDMATVAPWARAFLPRWCAGNPSEERPVIPAFGKVKRMVKHGVDVAYAAALFTVYPGMNVPAERIIELWDQGVDVEYAQVLMMQ